jgi:diguanylate cyclase (GGDEF)-like protein
MKESIMPEASLSGLDTANAQKVTTLFSAHLDRIHQRTDRMFACLMLLQWAAALAAALWLSPLTWSGATAQTHIHVWTALFLGGAITLYPVFLAWRQPGAVLTRHVIAVGQLLMSGLLIHLTGGRIETHFHVFGSLAFLAFYRDWRVLITATVVTALDHLLRGLVFPQSIYGIEAVEMWRWVEHAGWVIFEDTFLILACQWGLQDLRGICERDARQEASNTELEQKVEQRTTLLQEANSRLEALATTDPLTGLPNHRALVDLLDKELERSRRYERPCTVLFFDLDHFKALNDTCGHNAGDQALQEFGTVLQTVLRQIDTLGRWGGEEFVVVLPEMDTDSALHVGERLRAAVAEHLFLAGGGLYLTCSAGIATYPSDALHRSELLEAADRAMYAAKQMGRNQVFAFSDPIVKTLETERAGSREELILQGTVEALAGLVEMRDAYTGQHTEGVVLLANRLAKEMGLDTAEERVVALVAKLRDIGKVAVPDAILQKSGLLTEDEWVKMRMHPIIGAEVAGHVPTLRMAAPGIRGHHERWDGKGYPDGLVGESIPLAARIVAVADAYRTMLTERCFRRAHSAIEAMDELERCAGTQFDPAVVRALDCLGPDASSAEAEPFTLNN